MIISIDREFREDGIEFANSCYIGSSPDRMITVVIFLVLSNCNSTTADYVGNFTSIVSNYYGVNATSKCIGYGSFPDTLNYHNRHVKDSKMLTLCTSSLPG